MEFEHNFTKQQWDKFLADNDKAHIFNSFDWGEFKKEQIWKPIRLAVKEGERIVTIFPILEKRVPLFGKKIWYLPRGPVFRLDNSRAYTAIELLVDFARKEKVVSLKISPDIVLSEKTKQLKDYLVGLGFKETKEKDCQLHKCTIRVDLTGNFEEIFQNFKKNTRWEIKTAKEKGVIVEKGELDDFYNVYKGSMQRNKQDFLPKNYLAGLCQFFPDNHLILTVYKDDILLSGAFILFFGKRAWYMFGGSIKRQNNFYASQFLQSETIRILREKGIREYDLQGIACLPKTAYEIGAFQFKDGFGGSRVELLGEYDYIFSRFWHFMVKSLSPLYKFIFKNR